VVDSYNLFNRLTVSSINRIRLIKSTKKLLFFCKCH
jgi:hypothetical protein